MDTGSKWGGGSATGGFHSEAAFKLKEETEYYKAQTEELKTNWREKEREREERVARTC